MNKIFDFFIIIYEFFKKIQSLSGDGNESLIWYNKSSTKTLCEMSNDIEVDFKYRLFAKEYYENVIRIVSLMVIRD